MSKAVVLNHKGEDVRCMTFVPDGSQLVTVGRHETGVRFWDVSSGKPRSRWLDHPEITLLAASYNRLLTWHQGRARLWNSGKLMGGKVSLPLVAELKAPLENIALSDRHFILQQADHQVLLGDSQTGKTQFTFPAGYRFHFSNRGRRVLVGGFDWSRLYSTDSGRPVIETGTDCVVAAFSAEDRWMAMAGVQDKHVTLVDLDNLKIHKWDAHDSRVLLLGFSPDGLQVASVGEDGVLTLLELYEGLATSLPTNLNRPSLLLWLSPHRLVVGDQSGSYHIVAASRGQLKSIMRISSQYGSGQWCAGLEGQVAWAGGDQSVKVFRPGDSRPVVQPPSPFLSGDSPARRSASVQQSLVNDRVVLVGSQAWDLRQGSRLPEGEYLNISGHLLSRYGTDLRLHGEELEVLAQFPAPDSRNGCRAICSQARHFAFFDEEGYSGHLSVLRREGQRLEEWRTAPPGWRHDGEYIHTLMGGYPPVFYFSPCARYLAILAYEEAPRVWILESNRRVTLEGRPAFLPRGGWICGGPAGIELWDAQGERTHHKPAPENLQGVLLSALGFVVLVCADKAELWSLDLQQQLGVVPLSDVSRASISPDGKWLFVIHYHKILAKKSTQVSVWSLPDGRRLGDPQVFEPSSLRYLKIICDHGWMVATGDAPYGCWHLESGSFAWLPAPESLVGGLHPLPGGRLLMFTQNAAWHLYSGPPLRRLASLQTAADGSRGQWADYFIQG